MMNLAQSSAYVMFVFGGHNRKMSSHDSNEFFKDELNEDMDDIEGFSEDEDTDNHLNQFFSDSISLSEKLHISLNKNFFLISRLYCITLQLMIF